MFKKAWTSRHAPLKKKSRLHNTPLQQEAPAIKSPLAQKHDLADDRDRDTKLTINLCEDDVVLVLVTVVVLVGVDTVLFSLIPFALLLLEERNEALTLNDGKCVSARTNGPM